MRINKILVSALVMALSFYSCDYLDVPPINIIQDDAIFNSESGKIGRASCRERV